MGSFNDKKPPKMASPELLKELIFLRKQLSKENSSDFTKDLPLKEPKTEEQASSKEKQLRTYEEAFGFLKETSDQLAHNERCSLEKDTEISSNLIRGIQEDNTISSYVIGKKYSSDNVIHHSVNVTILALNIGIMLTDDENELIDIGKAALLHDIGLFNVNNIVSKKTKLSPVEIQTIKKHTLYGFDILSPFGKDYNHIGKIILQTHERSSGHGYPKGLKGDEILDSAKIIGIADVYESLTHERPYRKAFQPHLALKQIIREKEFPKEVLKALIQKISIFPEGSYVKLNNGVIAKVIKTNSQHPLKPVIEILSSPQNVEYKEGKIVNMTGFPLIYITKLLSENDSLSVS